MEDKTETTKLRGLGRGLNALFEDEEGIYPQASEHGQTPGRKREMIAVELLQPGKYQPRHVFDDEKIAELADSIKQHGVLQPLLVRKSQDSGDSYEIIGGERRWRAAQKAQLHEVPVVVLDLNDSEALEIALIENLQREDLSPIDEALGYQKLMDDFGHTQEKLAKALGKSRSHIANMVRLLKLPAEVQSMVTEGGLSMGHARALITAEDPLAVAQAVVYKGLSVRETEVLANELGGSKKQSKGKKSSGKTGKDADTLALESEVSNALGMAVNIDSKNGREGTLSINFKSLDQLDELLHKLSHFPGSRLSG